MKSQCGAIKRLFAHSDRPPERRAGKQVVGYYIEWGIYGRSYTVKNVKTSGSAEKLTAINYAFGNVGSDDSGKVVCKLADDWADYQKPWSADQSVTGHEVTWPRPILGNFQQLQALKEQKDQWLIVHETLIAALGARG